MTESTDRQDCKTWTRRGRQLGQARERAAVRGISGFTLIELMIAVVVVGVLAAIAYPSYREQINKSRRTDAQTALLELSQFMERYYTVKGTYLQSDGSAPTLPFVESPKDSATKYYDLSFSSTPSSTSYTLRAVPKGTQIGDTCGTLTISNTGAKNPTTTGCWSR
jgi:type IV pilus assembly protein PilE